MSTNPDFFQRKLSNTRSFTRQKRTSYAWLVVVIAILLLGGIAAYWFLFKAPVNLDNNELLDEGGKEQQNFSLEQEIYLKGEIKSNGDINYPWVIDDVKYGTIIIKGSGEDINFLKYSGLVELTGKVEKFYQSDFNSPIVRVYEISGALAEENEDDTDIVLDGNAGVYMLGAGIQFLPDFFDEYVLLNEGENGEIKIQNIESGEEFVINYFRCNAADPNRNCKGLAETFANNSAQSFVTSEGDAYYKQSEVQSWFVANGERRGVFINDVPDDVVYQLKDLIKFANERNINERIRSRAMKICQGSGEKMQKLTDSNVVLKQEGLIATISGDGKEKQMTCQILIDFTLPNKGSLQSLTIGDDIVLEPEGIIEQESELEDTESDKNEAEISSSESDVEKTDISGYGEWDPNVQQFPLNLEKGLIYNCTRGQYVLKFPSSNISYVASAVKENFGQNNLSCSYVINVIKYSEKEKVETAPMIRIYECSANGGVASWAANYVVYNVLGKVFVVQINDSSWIDFANNLQFSELSE